MRIKFATALIVLSTLGCAGFAWGQNFVDRASVDSASLDSASASKAAIALSGTSSVHFASKKQAGDILSRRDDYTRRLSKFDLTAKLQRKSPASVKKFLSFARKQGMSWNSQEQQRLHDIFNRLKVPLAAYVQFLPEKIMLVKTTGGVESGAFYTRGNGIFIPARRMTLRDEQLTTIMLHELFHIITRHNPQLRDSLYKAIGFVKTSELVLPDDVKERKISNPDVPILTHLIQVTIDGKTRWATPFIYSDRKYDRAVKRVFFEYLQLSMLVYDWDGHSAPVAARKNGRAVLVPFEKTEGLYEQIGRNTQYLFHPEEVLADNFALLVQGHNVASPEILEKMHQVFTGAL